MMSIKKIGAFALAAIMAAGMAACGDTGSGDTSKADTASKAAAAESETSPESAAESIAESKAESAAAAESAAEKKAADGEELKYIGDADAEKSTYSILVKNGTDQDITSFTIGFYEEFGDELIPDGETFAAGEERLLNISPADVYGLQAQIETKDGKEFILHEFPVTDMLSFEVRLMDEYAFIVYSNKVGESVDTMEEEAQAADEADDSSAAETTVTDPVVEEPQTEEPVTEPVQTEAPAETDPPQTEEPAQTEQPASPDQGCLVDDEILF